MNSVSVAVVGAGLAGIACAHRLQEAGVRAMNALPRFLARDLDVEYGARIVRLERSRRGWALLVDRGSAHADFTAVGLAMPAPAAVALAGSRTPLAGVPDAGFTPDPMLRWFARNGSKPGREAREAWTLHASPDWSRVKFDQSARNVQRAMLDRFSEHIGRSLPRTLVSDGHRWRHARVDAAWLSGRALGSALTEARDAIGSGKIQGSR